MSNTFVGGWEVCLAKHTNSLQCYEALRELRDRGSFAGTFVSWDIRELCLRAIEAWPWFPCWRRLLFFLQLAILESTHCP